MPPDYILINSLYPAKILLSHTLGRGKVSFDPKRCRAFRITTPSLKEEVLEVLTLEGFEIEELPFLEGAALACGGKKPLGSSIMNRFGYIYIQDLSSMLPPLYLSPPPGSRVLDMCASPGGKTSILSSLVGEGGVVVANEPNPSRGITLYKNMERMNQIGVWFTSHPGERFPLEEGFDYILADVPCSGWGTVEKNPAVVRLWRGKRIRRLISLQRDILRRAIALLKGEGRMIYSTCTTNAEENEGQIEWAIKELGVEVEPLPPVEGFVCESTPGGGLRISGGKYGGQGFFVCCVRGGNGRLDNIEERERDNFQWLDPEEILALLRSEGLKVEPFLKGRFYCRGRDVFFVCPHAPFHMGGRGIFLGELRDGVFSPNPALRCMVPDKGVLDTIVMDSVREVESLLQGNSLYGDFKGRFVSLYFKDLPLTLLRVKGKRCLLSR